MGTYVYIGFATDKGDMTTYLSGRNDSKTAIKAYAVLANISEEAAQAKIEEWNLLESARQFSSLSSPEYQEEDFEIWKKQEKFCEENPAFAFFHKDWSIRNPDVRSWIERHKIDLDAGMTDNKIAIHSYLLAIGIDKLFNIDNAHLWDSVMLWLVQNIKYLYWG